MAFFTGKGDGGTTKLFDSPSGVRVSKSSPIFECLGQLDELNSITGWARAGINTPHPNPLPIVEREHMRSILRDVQNHLFTIQAEVAGAQKHVPQESIETMTAIIKSIESQLPEVKSFLVAGGTELSARLDIARA
jgi:cob(I)alamin adenosyltransferase